MDAEFLKIIVVGLSVVFLIGCTETIAKEKRCFQKETTTSDFIKYRYAHDLYLFQIDSCEYIFLRYGSSHHSLVHKGNCRFCAERHRLEHKENFELLKNNKEPYWDIYMTELIEGKEVTPEKKKLYFVSDVKLANKQLKHQEELP